MTIPQLIILKQQYVLDAESFDSFQFQNTWPRRDKTSKSQNIVKSCINNYKQLSV